MIDIPINSKIKLNMHPQSIHGESQGAKSARIALGTLYVAEGRIRDMNAVVHNKALLHQKQYVATLPKPKEGHKKLAPALMYDRSAADHVISTGTPIALAALDAVDKTIVSLGEQVTRLDATIDQKITAGKNSTRGAELRVWASKQESPFLVLGPLFQKADENLTLVAEVLLGENFLSGITPDNKAVLRQVAANVLAGPDVEARKETSEALSHLTTAAKSFVEATAEIFTGLRSREADAINSIVKGDSNDG